MDYCWFEDARISGERIDVTMHVRERMETRNQGRVKNMKRMIALALRHGKTAEQCRFKEKHYLERKTFPDSCAIAYNGYCFIFNEARSVCITVYPLPAWFGSDSTRSKQAVRDWRSARDDDALYDASPCGRQRRSIDRSEYVCAAG